MGIGLGINRSYVEFDDYIILGKKLIKKTNGRLHKKMMTWNEWENKLQQMKNALKLTKTLQKFKKLHDTSIRSSSDGWEWFPQAIFWLCTFQTHMHLSAVGSVSTLVWILALPFHDRCWVSQYSALEPILHWNDYQ